MTRTSAIPILMYHGVDVQPSVVTIPPERFRWQMEWLYNHGYSCLPLSEISRCLRVGEDFPTRCVMLTFDDGYQSLYTEVFPVLQSYGFTATVFLVSGFCNKDNRWPGQPPNIPTMNLLTWGEIHEMARYGIEFGSHTINHPRLDRLDADSLNEEIVQSKAILQDRLGKPITVFAYPYGRLSEQVKQIVRNTYDLACSTNLGLATRTSDPHVLERVEVAYLAQRWIYQKISHPVFPFYLSLRNVGRMIRSAITTKV
ncbi:MAG: polysaccharide deacetylase family protein [Chloroflexota bacterium]